MSFQALTTEHRKKKKGKDAMTDERWAYLKLDLLKLKGTKRMIKMSKQGRKVTVL